MQKEYKGYNGTITLTEASITITPGIKGILLGGGFLRGNKSIPYSSVVAVQMKKAGMTAGYLQLTLMGGSEAKGGVFQAATDENTIMFHAMGGNNEKFAEAKSIIEERIMTSKSTVVHQRSDADELAKFSELKDKGVISEAEFDQKKKQLLGL